jgi:hypothetical protein
MFKQGNMYCIIISFPVYRIEVQLFLFNQPFFELYELQLIFKHPFCYPVISKLTSFNIMILSMF